MTQIRTIEDIIEVLNASPEIRTQFFEAFGLSALPELYGRMDAFETTQQGMLETQRGMLETQRGMLETQRGILDTLKEHSEELRALRQDVTTLNGRADTMSVDINTFKSVMLGNQAEDKAVNVVQAQLGTIVGSRVRRIALRFSQRRSLQPDVESYISPIDDAWYDEVITDPERIRLLATDLVFSGTVQGALHWFPVEVSNTIDSNDVARVAESARLIEKVFKNQAAIPLVAGATISDEVSQHAAESGVRVVTFEV